MTELRPLAPREGVALLRGIGARGFLGLDPVTQNDPLLLRELAAMDAHLFAPTEGADAVLGYTPNPDNPRQAYVATTSADPALLAELADHLLIYRRCTSMVCLTSDDTAIAALRGNGFRQAGLLRQHDYREGAYHDVHVYAGQPCAS
ncbi:MAG TPA: hypothetical protein VGM75_33930 [Pseudonocardiaceae bacterium]